MNKRKRREQQVKTITPIPDDLWNEIKNILPDEKPDNTIGCPIVPYRKVFDGIMFILRTGCQWKMYPKNMVLVQRATEDFKNGENQVYLINYGPDY